ncbi:MAG: CehA/McbA family metallohydrolase [Acidobacteria bacterium]|nr:CehA/McbA family metallohydrolase [Acidobacteriota bacterium]
MHAKTVSALVLAAMLALLPWRDKRIASAADGDSTTWGATDPTWSPDGRQLAFSLFGSIWVVDAQGGDARQITIGAGYHAHPAWSPKGDTIAFISGMPPAGPLPNIRGKLMLAEVASGSERQLATPHPTAGTPTWSGDGRRIACALAAPDSGALLHEIEVASGAIRSLQARPQRGASGNWVAASWNPKSEELFFAAQRFAAVQNGAQRLSPPQIWSMPSTAAPVIVQLPLTRYRLTDIAQLHSLSALPNGAGVIYSAVVVNGKGDRELYRVPRGGGTPTALTNTPRDEFSPAVSPDGTQIAHVSNHLGNIDIFTMASAGGEKRHVGIGELRFRRPSARLRLRSLDENGQPTPVRLYVRAADGKSYAPKGSPIFYFGLEPTGPREGFFLTNGDDTIVLPAGKVRLVALKGIEYRIEERSIDAAAGETTEVTIGMRRWTNWNQRGWYTGENHFHANYNGSYYQRPPQSLEWLEAVDLNAANMIVANSEGAFIHDKEFFTGAPSPLSKPRFILYWGQEYRNSDPLGHMAFLNIKKQVPPSFTSVIGSPSPYDYPLNTQAAQAARQQGGVVVYVHPSSGSVRDVMDTNLGAKEAPLTAALGAMDAIDILPFGPAAYELWYRLLNCGFRIVPGAGTDVFTNWRGINRIPGLSRQYVDVGSQFTWERWVRRYREGRVFVTNGPLLTFAANGHAAGSVVPAAEGSPYRVRLEAEVHSEFPVEKIELIQNGQVIDSRPVPAGAVSQHIEKEVSVDTSAWFAARVSGRPTRGLPFEAPRAHTGAVYVHVGGKPVLVREDAELMIRWLEALWSYLEERNNFGPAPNRTRARALFDQGLAHYRGLLAKAGAKASGN